MTLSVYEYGVLYDLSPSCSVIRAQNPSPMTGLGTNTYFLNTGSGLANEVALQAASQADFNREQHPTNPGWVVELPELEPVLASIPALPLKEKAEILLSILSNMAETGFTTGYVMDYAEEDALDVLRMAESISPLPIELRISPWFLAEHVPSRLDELIEMQGLSGDRWVVQGVKLMMDGTIDNGTAWLYEPDTQGESTHSIWLDNKQYAEAVQKLHNVSVQTNTHAIGDNAVGFVIETLSNLPKSDVRHRIEHIETLTDSDLETMYSAGITASMQPEHCTHFIEPDGSDNWSVRLGPERAQAEGFRFADICRKGVPLALGSDWPISESDSRQIFAAAVLRRPAGANGMSALLPGQEMEPREVLEGFTIKAQESVGIPLRTIEVGNPATFTAFANDPLHTEPEEFAQAEVVLTMINGDVVHAKSE